VLLSDTARTDWSVERNDVGVRRRDWARCHLYEQCVHAACVLWEWTVCSSVFVWDGRTDVHAFYKNLEIAFINVPWGTEIEEVHACLSAAGAFLCPDPCWRRRLWT